MNTSSRMMSFGEEQKIHVSKVTGDLLPKDFKVAERGQIEVKGKGVMTTCWVEDRVGRSTPVKDEVGADCGIRSMFVSVRRDQPDHSHVTSTLQNIHICLSPSPWAMSQSLNLSVRTIGYSLLRTLYLNGP